MSDQKKILKCTPLYEKRYKKNGGINCLIINSNIQEIDSITNEELEALIEINLSTEEMISTLKAFIKNGKN